MQEQLITLKTAKLAKEKGFKFEWDEHEFDGFELGMFEFGKRYDNNEIHPLSYFFINTHHNIEQWMLLDIPCPTQSLLQKWLRDVHGVEIEISKIEEGYKSYFFKTREEHVKLICDFLKERVNFHATYEEALEVGLLEALKLIK